MAHLGARAFEEIGGEVVQVTAFVRGKEHIKGYNGTYCRLIEPTSQQGKEDMFLAKENRYSAVQDNFGKIPGEPVAYWVSKNLLNTFFNKSIGEIAKPCPGLQTGCNERFVRMWFEVKINKIKFNAKSVLDTEYCSVKWFPYNKGGEFRRWYGNNDYVVNWYNNGFEIRNFVDKSGKLRSRPQNAQFYFHDCISWSLISSYHVAFRYKPIGHIFDVSGMSCFKEDNLLYLLALCNTPVVDIFLSVFSPTINFQAGDIANIPVIEAAHNIEYIEEMVKQNILISSQDWDSYETSWDFTFHPLLKMSKLEDDFGNKSTTIEVSHQSWVSECEQRFMELKANEEELNRIFIDIYGLQDELTPEVLDKDITVHRVFDTKEDIPESMKGSAYIRTRRDEIVSLLSYAVGCMFGRYSLDTQGLAYAGGEWDASKYTSFKPVLDDIIPITDEVYLEDDIDIITRLCTWLKVVYSENTLEENLDFIAKALGNKGNTSREFIRNYFLNDFFKDHCQTYSVTGSGKRPIYWLFDSGKQNGFKALIYLHRYNADTVGNLRIDYLHRMQRIYESEIERMQNTVDHVANARDVAAAKKRKEKLQKQLKECREYDEKIAHLALSRIELDLDDGVKVNYRKIQTGVDGKFYEVLADSKNIMSKER